MSSFTEDANRVAAIYLQTLLIKDGHWLKAGFFGTL